MANNYTLTSAKWECGEECAEKVERLVNLWNETRDDDHEPLDPEDADKLKAIEKVVDYPEYGVFGISKEDDGLWFRHEESADINMMVAFVEEAQRRGWSDVPFVIEFAFTCSKPRLNEFGGGACVIYKGQSHWVNTGTWALQKRSQLLGESKDLRRGMEGQIWRRMDPAINGAQDCIHKFCEFMDTSDLCAFVRKYYPEEEEDDG